MRLHVQGHDHVDGRFCHLGHQVEWNVHQHEFQNSEKGVMMKEFYPIRYVYTTDRAVENKLLNDYQIYVHKMNLSKVKNIPIKTFLSSEKQTYDWASKQIYEARTDKEKFFKTIMRLNYLKGFKTKEQYVSYILSKIPEDEKCLIFCNTIEQAERLCSYSHHSKTKNDYLEAFNEGIITRLSCVEQLSEGINIKDLKHAIILHTYSGSSPKTKQKFSRNLRLNVGEKAYIHFLCYKNTVDENWVDGVLEDFNKDKIKTIEINNP